MVVNLLRQNHGKHPFSMLVRDNLRIKLRMARQVRFLKLARHRQHVQRLRIGISDVVRNHQHGTASPCTLVPEWGSRSANQISPLCGVRFRSGIFSAPDAQASRCVIFPRIETEPCPVTPFFILLFLRPSVLTPGEYERRGSSCRHCRHCRHCGLPASVLTTSPLQRRISFPV